MIIRRAFRYWQFIAAIVLPVWLLVGWAIFSGGGWGLIGLVLVCPIAFIALLVIALLISARKSVREARAVSWLDVGLLTLWHLSIIGIGFFGVGGTWFAVGAVVIAIAVFWIVLWELITEARNRVVAAFAAVDSEAADGAPRGPQGTFSSDGNIIVVQETNADHPGPAHV